MFLKEFFGNKKIYTSNLSVLNADMHSHLIPGIDDGSKTIEESIVLLKKLKNLGYSKIITTPHIQSDFNKNTPETINNGYIQLSEALKSENIDICLEVAAEYMIDDRFYKILKSGNLMTFGDKYILIELSFFNPPNDLNSLIFDLEVAGYKVILAHAERYFFWHDDFSGYEDLKNRNIYFQVNIISLGGYYSKQVKKIAEKLIKNNMVEFLGSDVHNINYINFLEKTILEKSFQKILETKKFLNNKL